MEIHQRNSHVDCIFRSFIDQLGQEFCIECACDSMCDQNEVAMLGLFEYLMTKSLSARFDSGANNSSHATVQPMCSYSLKRGSTICMSATASTKSVGQGKCRRTASLAQSFRHLSLALHFAVGVAVPSPLRSSYQRHQEHQHWRDQRTGVGQNKSLTNCAKP